MRRDRRAEGRDLGGDRSHWVEKGGKVVEKAESAGEFVKKSRASRRIGRLSISSQTEQADRNEDRNDGQERRAGMTH